jgi:threonine/homoserine/homoserine lactone efflux protein
MTFDLFLAVALYGFVTSITPGPNNTMLLASGLNYGLKRSWPHIWGINIGFTVMVAGVGLGLGAVFTLYPVLHTVLKVAGTLYLLYLAWRIARSGAMDGKLGESQPLTFFEAAAFQWVNPKAWVMAIGAISAYVPPGQEFVGAFIVALIFGLVNLPSIVAWAGFGSLMRNVLTKPSAVQVFNVAMAALLVASLIPTTMELILPLLGDSIVHN